MLSSILIHVSRDVEFGVFHQKREFLKNIDTLEKLQKTKFAQNVYKY
jgi:hypothetical protein